MIKACLHLHLWKHICKFLYGGLSQSKISFNYKAFTYSDHMSSFVQCFWLFQTVYDFQDNVTSTVYPFNQTIDNAVWVGLEKTTHIAYYLRVRTAFLPSILPTFEPAHEIMALFVLRKLIRQTHLRSHPVGLDIWFLVRPFTYFHTSCVRTAKALARLRRCLSLHWSPMC